MKGAAVLKQARAEEGLTQAQLATILGVNTRTIQRWEAGNSMPNAAQFGALRVVLHLHVTTWLDDAERERLASAWAVVKHDRLSEEEKRIEDNIRHCELYGEG